MRKLVLAAVIAAGLLTSGCIVLSFGDSDHKEHPKTARP